MTNLKQHPLSAAFPAMSADDFAALRDSIEAVGVQNPITVFDGMVIDGWHRYTAANELGMACPSVELGDTDPRDFVLAQNKARRHITQAQLALATTAVYQWRPHGDQRSTPGVDRAKTTAELADIAGVHANTITQAKAVQTKAAPEVLDAVKSGAIGLRKAAAIANLPKEEQAAAIAKPIIKAKQPEPAPEPVDHELEEATNTIVAMADEMDELRDMLAAAQMGGDEAAKAEGAQLIADLRAQIKTLEAELDAVKSSRDVFMRENAELKKQVLMQQRQLKKLGA